MPLIEPGQRAPAFTLNDQRGNARKLADFRGRALVMYFYPEDDTPLCTTEACQFRDAHAEIRSLGAEVVGISPDSSESHSAFAAKFSLPFTLLADVRATNGAPRVCDLYGVWREKNMYGKKVIGMVRTTYLIDGAGVVVRRWDGVKTPTHGAQVMRELESLAAGTRAANRQRPRH